MEQRLNTTELAYPFGYYFSEENFKRNFSRVGEGRDAKISKNLTLEQPI